MDEPCASLDLGNQMLLIGQLKKLAADGMAVIMTTHEPNHAFALGGRALCMGRGGSLACGPVEELLTPQLLSELYGIDVEVVPVHARNGSSACGCIPLLSTSEPQRA